MFGIGAVELLVIAGIALVVLKPADVPKLLRQLGLVTATLRQNWHGIYHGWLEQADATRKP